MTLIVFSKSLIGVLNAYKTFLNFPLLSSSLPLYWNQQNDFIICYIFSSSTQQRQIPSARWITSTYGIRWSRTCRGTSSGWRTKTATWRQNIPTTPGAIFSPSPTGRATTSRGTQATLPTSTPCATAATTLTRKPASTTCTPVTTTPRSGALLMRMNS